jgi:hypothetical protein
MTLIEEDLVAIGDFAFLHEAELAASALHAAGIRCTVPDRFSGGRTPGIFTGENFRILVSASDAKRAREVLHLDAS